MSLADELLADLENPEDDDFIPLDTNSHMIVDDATKDGIGNLYMYKENTETHCKFIVSVLIYFQI